MMLLSAVKEPVTLVMISLSLRQLSHSRLCISLMKLLNIGLGFGTATAAPQKPSSTKDLENRHIHHVSYIS